VHSPPLTTIPPISSLILLPTPIDTRADLENTMFHLFLNSRHDLIKDLRRTFFPILANWPGSRGTPPLYGAHLVHQVCLHVVRVPYFDVATASFSTERPISARPLMGALCPFLIKSPKLEKLLKPRNPRSTDPLVLRALDEVIVVNDQHLGRNLMHVCPEFSCIHEMYYHFRFALGIVFSRSCLCSREKTSRADLHHLTCHVLRTARDEVECVSTPAQRVWTIFFSHTFY